METGSTYAQHLISVEELASLIFEGDDHALKTDVSPSLKIIDASMGNDKALEGFKEKSIPGARFLNMMKDLKDKDGKYPNTFPNEATVKEVLQNLGISKDDDIIVYGQPGKAPGSARTFFVLDSYGLKVRVLNGGLKKYVEAGYPTQPGVDYTGEPGVIDSLACPKDNLWSLEDIIEFGEGKRSDFQLIDFRPAKAFNGEATDNIEGCRQGHVEGAINIPPSELVYEDTTLKTDEDLKAVLEKYNVDLSKNTVAMCRTGIAATVGLAALKNVTSTPLPKIQVYDGSWSEYGSLPSKI